ncbi:MAG TPA: 23S rRNA (pseudouridine(1915)-N(3))-methyltransferase RlmH [Pantanalinema sp.]
MKWSVVAVGRVKESWYRDAIAEYHGRLQHYRPFAMIEVAEERLIPGREAQVMRKEAERIADACPPGLRIALSERGARVTTSQLTDKLAQFEGQGVPHLSFVLGGPQGLDPDFIRSCHWELSLSGLTFPYQLARLVLVEQLYRCETLRRGEPYHKA